MPRPRAFIKASVALALTSSTFFALSASGQSPAARPNSTVAVSEPQSGNAETRAATRTPNRRAWKTKSRP